VARPLPASVRQVFDSFELVTAVVPTEPLVVEITSSDTEGGDFDEEYGFVLEDIAPATIEFEADVTGGTGPYTYSWDFGDGSVEIDDDETVEHTFEEAGSYNVGLTVTDSIGQSASDSMEITVEEAPEEVVEVEEEEEVEVEVEVEEQPPAADEVEEEIEPDLDDVDNNSGSDDLFDVDDFLDDLFDRLGLR
jgi:PKD repeat protein